MCFAYYSAVKLVQIDNALNDCLEQNLLEIYDGELCAQLMLAMHVQTSRTTQEVERPVIRLTSAPRGCLHRTIEITSSCSMSTFQVLTVS